MSDDDKFELLAKLIQKLYEITDSLNAEFASEGRRFTLDGHLLGSIGEVLASYVFDLELERSGKRAHDARTKDGKQVQIKLTAVNSRVALNHKPDFLIVLQLSDRGLEVIYNGSGELVWRNCKEQINRQYAISVRKLRQLNSATLNPLPLVRALPVIRRRPNSALLRQAVVFF